MGSLTNFNSFKNVQSLVDKHKITNFIETGCFRGNSLSFALKLNGIKKFYSCDIDPEAVEYCRSRFKEDSRLTIYNFESVKFLKKILPMIEGNCLFWLDAHLPDFDKTSGQVYIDNKFNFPLEKELKVIRELSDQYCSDVIIIDDLRIYEDGDFEGGNWEDRQKFQKTNISFLEKYDYNIEKFYQQEGYILLTK